MKALSKIHTEFEEEIIKTLGPDQTLNKFCTKDYQLLQQDKDRFPSKSSILYRDVLFEFHLKFWNNASIGIPVRRLLL